jgi:hypothetical protein
MDATTAIALAILGIIWFVLMILAFRPPDTPKLSRLVFFLMWLAVSIVLGWIFLVKVYKFNPNPLRVDLARWLTKDHMIYLGDFVPGLFDLDYIQRVDTDWEEENLKEEWLAFYEYDVTTRREGVQPTGPWGGAIYDHDACRPPAILSFELIPISYDYLGQDRAYVTVGNIIQYADPLSGLEDRPEVLISGTTRGVVTDLNIFRKAGVDLDCLQRQQWQAVHPGEAFPNPYRYENIGSFRGIFSVERQGSTVTVVDRGPFERSQLVVRRQYRPENGYYFQPGTEILLEPVEYTVDFGPGRPDEVTQVYYPEKSVLAFYKNLGKDADKLAEAQTWLSPGAQQAYDIETNTFGLSAAPESVARAREDLARVLVWEIRYDPDVEAEQLHMDRRVTVIVVGVSEQGYIDYDHPCEVTWTVIGQPRSGALPYNCEWRLDSYVSTCPPPGEMGAIDLGVQSLSQTSPND